MLHNNTWSQFRLSAQIMKTHLTHVTFTVTMVAWDGHCKLPTEIYTGMVCEG